MGGKFSSVTLGGLEWSPKRPSGRDNQLRVLGCTAAERDAALRVGGTPENCHATHVGKRGHVASNRTSTKDPSNPTLSPASPAEAEDVTGIRQGFGRRYPPLHGPGTSSC